MTANVSVGDRDIALANQIIRWVDGQISTAHIDGRVMDREVARNDDAGIGGLGPDAGFELARIPVRVSWTGYGYGWERA